MGNTGYKTNKSFKFDRFIKGQCYDSYEYFGCHLGERYGHEGAYFKIWAPAAEEVSVVGSFNDWDGRESRMHKDNHGIWSIFIKGVVEGDYYMYRVVGADDKEVLKSDPYSFYSQLRPGNASIVANLEKYKWNDDGWFDKRKATNVFKSPLNIYELHAGSWKTHDDDKLYNYKELAEELVDYAYDMGYTHIELMPLTEHPLDESWGYQTIGYYSVTSRYGTPEEFMYFVDRCHEKGIGLILDWVPGHFCKDEHGLYKLDGTFLYESMDESRRENYDWGTANFDFDKLHVHSFLISNALFWFKKYHIDGIRVDAVANMMYLNYGKKHSLGLTNKFGGDENIEAIEFLKKLNEVVFKKVDNPLMIAEDSSIRSMVTAPTYTGGIGFNYKWNMGWMNEILKYIERDAVHRKWHHNSVTFTMTYAYNENYVLPLSHDEVVHGKKSLLNKMPGDYWQKFAGLRVLLGYMMGHAGKKLLFMGGEFGQFIEWNCKKQLDWLLLDYPAHKSMQHYVKALNHLYLNEKALWELDHSEDGFTWIDHQNYEQSIISFMRTAEDGSHVIVICNFTPVVHYDYKIGVPELKQYKEIFNSDSKEFGGSGQIVESNLQAFSEEWNSQPYHIKTKISPLGFVVLKTAE